MAADRVNRIAFISNQGQLATVAPDGHNLRLLTTVGRVYQFPAWSPDASALAVIGGVRGENAGVYIIPDTDAMEQGLDAAQTLYESSERPPIYLYWRPDGEAVSYIAANAEGMQLQLAGRNGDLRTVASGQPCFWQWSADGERLLTHTNATSDEAQLGFLDPYGHPAGPAVARPGMFQSPGIAPSGECWAFGEVDVLHTTQVAIARRNSRLRTVAGHMGIAAMGWSPVADLLAFISPNGPARHCYGPLRLVDATSEERRILVRDVVLAFFWSPDGTQIAYFTLDGPARERLRLFPNAATGDGNGNGNGNGNDSGERTPERPAQNETLMLALWVVDIATGTTRKLHSFYPLPLLVNRLLPFFDQYGHSHRLWSPDSDALLLPVVNDSTPEILLVPSNGSPPTTVTEGIMAFWSPR